MRSAPDRAEDEEARPTRDGVDVDRILETLVYLYTESRRVTKERARHFGITGPQVTAIKVLESFGELSLTDLSARMSATNSTVTGIADRMERDGLVERVRSETDRRVIRIRLTDKGRELASQIPIASMALFADALRSLDEKDRRDLTRILRKLTDKVTELVGADGD